uniref:EF-hand domain-containing protein n=1 Tax=Ciona intestinalis TaxID=7719 RepID=F6R0E7_CIOIN
RPHSARGDFPQNIPNDITDKSPSTPHPHLVSKVTGRANLHLVLKHFPYLTVEQVSKQWENFRRFDKNNDFKLDLPELYEAVGGHGKVTVNEIREAMREVDRDQSNNIDFYEYLKISEMIFKNQGDSAIFKSGLLHHNGSASSEACVLQ